MSEHVDGLSIQGLVVRFGGLTAVDDVRPPRPRRGGSPGSSGRTAPGKTTTFNACTGLVRPTARQGAPSAARTSPRCSTQHRAQRGLGRTFQRMELFESLTVRENVALGREAVLAGRNPLRHIWTSRAGARPPSPTAGRRRPRPVRHRPAGRARRPHRRCPPVSAASSSWPAASPADFRLLLLDEPSVGPRRCARPSGSASILRDAGRDRGRRHPARRARHGPGHERVRAHLRHRLRPADLRGHARPRCRPATSCAPPTWAPRQRGLELVEAGV